MIGILRLENRYRFVTNEKQLIDLAEDLDRNAGSVYGTTIFIDTNLIAKHSTKISTLLSFLLVEHRKLSVTFVLVGNMETKIDTRMKMMITAEAKLHLAQLTTRTSEAKDGND